MNPFEKINSEVIVLHDEVGKIDMVVTTVNSTAKPTNNIKNMGTGAGGAHTNKNGLPYENLTDLNTEYRIISKNKHCQTITFNEHPDSRFIQTKQAGLFKTMDHEVNTKIPKGHGCKRPDEAYIRENGKVMYIIEKKFQQTGGSVCEKIQTPHMKLWQYRRTFPKYTIVYIYSLSDWFKTNCVAELEYLEHINVPVFWGSSASYKSDIINFIVNYK